MAMDSLYHSTVMQRPAEEEQDGVGREGMNGNTRAYNARSPDFRSPYSPNNSHPRPQYDNHPPTPVALPMPSNIPGSQPTPRDRYYDPTSDRLQENQNLQVRDGFDRLFGIFN